MDFWCRFRPDSTAMRVSNWEFWFSHELALQNLLVEVNGIEPMTSCLQSRRSPN